MKKILLFGAGKSSTVLIDYLLGHALSENWTLTVVDANAALAREKIGDALGGLALSFDVSDPALREQHISDSDLVISLLPPSLHFLVAQDCLRLGKHLLTASYVDDNMRSLAEAAREKGLLFLCEMGLDPGIDHMSAMRLLDEIRQGGGKVTSFHSHCGGLVAPESDNNPWRYKISWNPRNVVLAGKAGAVFRLDGEDRRMEYPVLFAEKRFVEVPGYDPLCWYPNRDSLSYIPLYRLDDCPTFIRTTLRYPDFIYGWKNIVDLKLTDETADFDSDGKTLSDFYHQHLERHGFSGWLQQRMSDQFETSKKILEDLMNLVELQEEVSETADEKVEGFMMVNESGSLQDVDIEDLKTRAAETVALKMHDAKLTLSQLFYLGLDDKTTLINKGRCSAADVLQLALELKLALKPGDRDLVVMLHEIGYEMDGRRYLAKSSFSLEGENDHHTAMAKTVGLPLGIAARLVLNGSLQERGLHIPITPAFYKPVLAELDALGIRFTEEIRSLS
ncbi:saccharopine dehydrogenase [Flaviaesturariibacter flavus]|uniref:Saccharopine dehydrogenase n=1 Tax=Flaviaesturariibacter flavus TaxID=2502780 RepID=A0A4R1BN99_9BACT|nr:saccharopine dehydrogenase C-terminal domain-containing protein [Flaviaesturariibacter flavus]TCJ19023.1 saccharopine dehydrogenase [Flaviaesturariibacter flavus]